MLDNILASKLYRPGSVAYVSRSGGMSNELNNIVSRTTDGVYEGVAIGGDRYENRFENICRGRERRLAVKLFVLWFRGDASHGRVLSSEALLFSSSRYPGSTFIDHVLRYQDTPDVKMIIVLGEVGEAPRLFTFSDNYLINFICLQYDSSMGTCFKIHF